MNEKSKSRTRLAVSLFSLVVLLFGGAMLVWWLLKPVDPAEAFLNDLRQNAIRVEEKIAVDSRLRRNVTLNNFVVDVVYPMFDEKNQTLIAPQIEFESNDTKISEVTFNVYHDTNGNFVCDDDEPVVKWNGTNISVEKDEVFTMEDRSVATEMLDAVKAGGDLRFSCTIMKPDGGEIATHDKVQVKK